MTVGVVAGCGPAGSPHDIVIENGRVIDPETGFFAVTNVGILDGTIATISQEPLEGNRIIDASGHVVAPGFIDLHEHGQSEEAYVLMVRDGVTTALELEVGAPDIDRFYSDRASGQIVNYGASIGHIGVRMDLLGDPG